MKKLIRLLGILLSQAFQILTPYLHSFASLIEKYSGPMEKDFLRIAVIKSLKCSFTCIFDFLNFERSCSSCKITPKNELNKNSEHLPDASSQVFLSNKDNKTSSNKIIEEWDVREKLNLFLKLNKNFIILLQDEIPEIRQKVGKLLSYGKKNEFGFRNLFNSNYVLDGLFNKIALLEVNQGKMDKGNIQIFFYPLFFCVIINIQWIIKYKILIFDRNFNKIYQLVFFPQ